MKRKRKQLPKDETKADRFIRVVTPRVAKALKAIRVIGFCSGPAYDFTTEQAEELGTALLREVDVLLKRFAGSGQKQEEFSFTSKR